MSLTENGLLLQRRARDILSLVDMTESELCADTEIMEGSISIGAGELASLDELLSIVTTFHDIHPNVVFNMHTGIANEVAENLERGLYDFGLFLEPADMTGYDYIRMKTPERWVAAMPVDDPLTKKAVIKPADLLDRQIILPARKGVQSELARWFGNAYGRIDVHFTVNLGGLATAMLAHKIGILLCVEGSCNTRDKSIVTTRPLKPGITSGSLLAWKRDVAQTNAVHAFIEHARSFYTVS